jgi:thiopeptide-type bacteriocin biosynthesis protein
LRKDGVIRVWESYQNPRSGLFQKRRQVFFNEVIIPVFNLEKVSETSGGLPTKPDQTKRWQTEQDGWLFLKIYANESVCEDLLAGKLQKLCEKLAHTGRIIKWFFIRYADRDPHIRLRFLAPNPASQPERIRKQVQKLHSAELDNGLVFRIQTELYERETERYSMMSYEAVESIFHIDSVCALGIVSELKSKTQKHHRWLAAMLACDGILDAFGMQTPEKITLISGRGPVLEKSQLVYLNQLLRENKHHIFGQMTAENNPFDQLAGIRQLITARNHSLKNILDTHLIEDDRQRRTLACDLLHLCCNRLIVSDHLHQEHSIYHFLKKYYHFQLNISKTKSENLPCNHY